MIESLVMLILWLIVIGLVGKLLLIALAKSEIPAPFNGAIQTLIYVACIAFAILLILRVAPLPAGF